MIYLDAFFFLVAAAVLFLLVRLRRHGKPGIQITGPEITLAVLPLLVYGLFTGRIAHLEVAGVKVDSYLKEASKTEVSAAVLPVRPLKAEGKGNLAQLERLKLERPEALTFVLGSNRYVGEVICDYMRTLSSLRYLILTDNTGGFSGLVPIDGVVALVSGGDGECRADALASWINRDQIEDIGAIPGFVSGEEAATPSWSKRKCLSAMEKKRVDAWPVVDNAEFAGVVERSAVVAGLIIDVATRLEE